MGVPTLVSMAQRACMRNAASVKDVGDMRYELVRPILDKIESPKQLEDIEDASPHIADHTAGLWKAFIARDIMDWKDKIVEPKNPRSWGKVYRKLMREDARADAAAKEQLRVAMSGLQKKREENQSQYLGKVIIPTRGTKSSLLAHSRANSLYEGWAPSKTPTLKNAKTGSDILSAIRKQSSNAQHQKHLGRAELARVSTAKRQIPRAPQSMVAQYTQPAPARTARQDRDPTFEAKKVSASGPPISMGRHAPTAEHRAIDAALRADQLEREDRLRVLASGQVAPNPRTTTRPAAPAASSSKHTASSAHATIPVPSRWTATQQSTVASSPTRLDEVKAIDDSKKQSSPSPRPMKRRQPAAPPSIFMAPKKRKVH